jgi:hypothetical protein
VWVPHTRMRSFGGWVWFPAPPRFG